MQNKSGKVNKVGIFNDTFVMRHLGQGKDIAGGQFVPDMPRARGAEVFLLVDLGYREEASPVCARHGIFLLSMLLKWMVRLVV